MNRIPVADDELLLEAARKARLQAYAPYSHFGVGAALRCEDGTVITACNVENGSYGLSMCAERCAVFAAVAGGRRRYRAVAVAGPAGAAAAPCGACRQVLAEFGTDTRLLYTTPAGYEATTVGALLPAHFSLPANS